MAATSHHSGVAQDIRSYVDSEILKLSQYFEIKLNERVMQSALEGRLSGFAEKEELSEYMRQSEMKAKLDDAVGELRTALEGAAGETRKVLEGEVGAWTKAIEEVSSRLTKFEESDTLGQVRRMAITVPRTEAQVNELQQELDNKVAEILAKLEEAACQAVGRPGRSAVGSATFYFILN